MYMYTKYDFYNSPFEAGQDNKLTTGRPKDVVGTATNTLCREEIPYM